MNAITKSEQLSRGKAKTPRARKCLCCKKWFNPIEEGITNCSTDCAILHGKSNFTKQVKREKAKAVKEFNENDTKWLKKQARYWRHKYIRLRDKDKPCVSCNLYYTELNTIQAGHFKNDGNHAMVRYHEDNINGQCVRCNMHKGGEEKRYEEGLRKRIGDERVDYILSIAFEVKSYSAEELREIIEISKTKIKAIG